MDTEAKMKLYKTATLCGHFVKLVFYAPASKKHGHAAYYMIRTIDGQQFTVFASELTDFCL
jgi:hypothetical protein